MGRALFIADLHIGGERILHLCHRPFANLAEEDEVLIRNWKDALYEEDTVYLLGDTAEGDYERTLRILGRLPGHKMLVVGNHDDETSITQYQKVGIFEEITSYAKTCIGEKEVILFHYPILDWENRQYGSLLIYGHIHNKNLPEVQEYYRDKPCYNCGADVVGFRPRTLEELIQLKEAR